MKNDTGRSRHEVKFVVVTAWMLLLAFIIYSSINPRQTLVWLCWVSPDCNIGEASQ